MNVSKIQINDSIILQNSSTSRCKYVCITLTFSLFCQSVCALLGILASKGTLKVSGLSKVQTHFDLLTCTHTHTHAHTHTQAHSQSCFKCLGGEGVVMIPVIDSPVASRISGGPRFHSGWGETILWLFKVSILHFKELLISVWKVWH